MMDGSSFWRRRNLMVAAVVVLTALLAGCDGDEFEEYGFYQEPFPEEQADETMASAGEVRVTSHGLGFMEDELVNMLEAVVGEDGLSFCIPPTYTDDADVCHEDTTCDDGSTGCQVDLEMRDVSIDPNSPDEVIVDFVIDGLYKDEDLPLTVNASSTDCWLDLYSDDDSDEAAEIPVVATVRLSIEDQSAFRDVRIDLDPDDITVDLDDVDYNLHNRDAWICGGYDWVVSWFFDGTLRDTIADEIDEMVDEISRDELCRQCGAGEPDCPDNASCQDVEGTDVCLYDDDQCVPRALGISGVMELDEVLGEFLPGGAEDIRGTGRAADSVEIDSGVSLGLRTGAEPVVDTECAPVDRDERPTFDEPPTAEATGQDVDPDDVPYMFGLSIHERTIEHALWSVWASGGLCPQVGYETVELLTTDTIGALVDGIDELATRTGPVQIRITPQNPPDFELGDNVVNDGDIDEPLVLLQWDDLDVHMYGFIQERFARMFTLRIDMELPVAITPDGDDAVLPVFGEFEEAFDNMRVLDDDLVDADEETFEELVPMLLGFAVPELMDELDDPIELPSFFGYRVVFEEGDLRALEDGTFIGLFADLEFAGVDDQLVAGAPEAVIHDHHLEIDDPDGAIPQVGLELEVGAEIGGGVQAAGDYEYLYRFGNGAWRPAGSGDQLRIDDPRLSAQGVHQLQLRAKDAAQPGGLWQRGATTRSIVVDYEAPSLEVWRSDDRVVVDADDAVDDVEDLEMRHRMVVDDRDGDWSDWGEVRDLELDEYDEADGLVVEVEIRDRAGWVADTEIEIRRSDLDSTDHPPIADDQPEGLGCSVTSGGGGGLIGLMVVVLVVAAVRRRRRLATIVAAAVVVASLGCSDTPSTTSEDCDDACEAGQACIDEECVDVACDDVTDCQDEHIICEEGEVVCDGGQCQCIDPCGNDCESDEFCCWSDNSCQQLPDPCAGETCEEGYEIEVAESPDYDTESCEVGDGRCECVPLDPIPIEHHGAYPSVDEGGEVTALAVHNISYGDLMVGTVDAGSVDQWHFVDGVPDEGLIDGDPEGPRGGMLTSGDTVGTHTATAVDDQGRIHVMYRNQDDRSLRYARGEAKGDKPVFEKTTIEEGDDLDTGYYTEVELVEGVLEVFYTARIGDDSEVRHRSIDADAPLEEAAETEPEVLHDGSAPRADLENYPAVAGLFLETTQTDDGIFVALFDNTRQQIGWIAGGDDGDFDDVEFAGIDEAGPYASVKPDDDGDIHLAYMDGDDLGLMYHVEGDEPEEVVDGIRETDRGYSQSPVGHDVSLDVSDQEPQLVYHDASVQELRRASRSDDGWAVQTVAGEAGDNSVGRGMYVESFGSGGGHFLIDLSVDTTAGASVAEPVIQTLD